MSSCNVLSLIWAISPISTAGCAVKTSCNAALAKVAGFAAGSMACAWERSCNAGAEFPGRRQYPG